MDSSRGQTLFKSINFSVIWLKIQVIKVSAIQPSASNMAFKVIIHSCYGTQAILLCILSADYQLQVKNVELTCIMSYSWNILFSAIFKWKWLLHHGKYYDKKIKIGIWVWVMGCHLTNKCQFLVLNWMLSKRYNFGILVPNLVSQYQKLVSDTNICNHRAKAYLFYNDKY